MDSSELLKKTLDKDRKEWPSTRHDHAPPEDTRHIPRLGRRESEPHPVAITYLHDVLTHHFPEDRVLWDLHHYFSIEGMPFDIQFDVSYFQKFNLPQLVSSYKAADYGNRIPTMAINILSKSTFRDDVGENVDICRLIGIPVYVIFCSHSIESNTYRPPFLRVYLKQPNGSYNFVEIRKPTCFEGVNANPTLDTNVPILPPTLDPTAIIDTSAYVPFRLGLMTLKVKYFPDQPVYQLILIDPKELKIFSSQLEEMQESLKQEKIQRKKAEQEVVELQKQLSRYKSPK